MGIWWPFLATVDVTEPKTIVYELFSIEKGAIVADLNRDRSVSYVPKTMKICDDNSKWNNGPKLKASKVT